MSKPNNADKLRYFLRKVKVWPVSSRKELAEACGLTRDALRFTLKDFLKRGEMIQENSYYKYVGRKERELLIDRVWKAWRYTPTWTVNEIVRLTDADPLTIRSYIKKYRKADLIEVVGKRNTHHGRELLYRLKSNERRRPW